MPRFQVPETRTYYGCKIEGITEFVTVKPENSTLKMRFVVIGFEKMSECKKKTNHEYWKNLGRAIAETDGEKKRKEAGKEACTSKEKKQIDKYYNGLWAESSKATGCGASVSGERWKPDPCRSYAYSAYRTVKDTRKTGTPRQIVDDCEAKRKACRKNKELCGTVDVSIRDQYDPKKFKKGTNYTGHGVVPKRICNTNHANGRAADIMNYVSPTPGVTGTYILPDYLDKATVSTCSYKVWDFYAKNAHRYYISGIPNEWWHWEFFGVDKIGRDPIPPAIINTEPPTPPSATEETGEPSNVETVEVVETGEGSTQPSGNLTEEEIPVEDVYEFVDSGQFEYSSLEAVEQTLPDFTITRPQARLTGNKYLQDDLDLLVIDRFKNLINTQDGSTPSRWESIKPAEEQPLAVDKKKKLENLTNRKSQLEQDVDANKNLTNKLSAMLDKLSSGNEFNEEGLDEQTINDIRNIADVGTDVKTLIESSVNSGETANNLLNTLLEDINAKEIEIDNIANDLIPSAEKEYQSAINEIQSARDVADGRLSNLVSGIGVKIPNLLNSQTIDDTFKLFNEGDKALKEPIKVKFNKIPKISDFAVQLAGGLGLQSLLSSLSFAGLPGIDELDKLKSMADEAQASIEGELSGLSGGIGDIGVSDALQAFQDLKTLKSQAESVISEAKGLYDQAENLKKEAEDKIQQAEAAFENAKSTATNLANDLRKAGEDLKSQGASLLEQAKDLPSGLANDLIAKGNELISQGEQKIKDAKSSFEQTINSATNEYNKLTGEANSLNKQYQEIQNNPKLQQAKSFQAKLDAAQSEVDSISNNVSPEIVSKLERAADYKTTADTLKVKAAIVQKNILSNAKTTGSEIDVKKHFAKDFKPFSEWVLDQNNTVAPDSEQPSFIIHRGATGKVNEPNFNRLKDGTYKNFGISRYPTKYKSYCDFGNAGDYVVSNKKLFDGYIDKIMSPIDIAILLNAGNVGMFNNVIPYGFGEGSELAAPITFQKTLAGRNSGALFSKGGVGLGKNSNWAYFPEWAGLYVNFLLDKNGVYQSDLDFMDFTYVRRVESQYLNGNGVRLKNTDPITSIPKSYPGAVICYYNKASRKGNIELLLRVTLGGFLTLAGNTKIEGASKVGSTHGLKFYSSLKEFSPNDDVMIISRGKKSSWTTNNRLDGRIKRTEIIDEYMKSIENKNSPKNTKLLAGAYSLLRDHLSDIIYTRDERKNNILSDTFKPISTDTSFQLHNEFNSYISGSRPLALDYNVVIKTKEDIANEGQGH